jgi:hypothetical protein
MPRLLAVQNSPSGEQSEFIHDPICELGSDVVSNLSYDSGGSCCNRYRQLYESAKDQNR